MAGRRTRVTTPCPAGGGRHMSETKTSPLAKWFIGFYLLWFTAFAAFVTWTECSGAKK